MSTVEYWLRDSYETCVSVHTEAQKT